MGRAEDDEIGVLAAGVQDDLLGGVSRADDFLDVAAVAYFGGNQLAEMLAGIFGGKDVVLDYVQDAEVGAKGGGDVGGDGDGVLRGVGECSRTEDAADGVLVGGNDGAFDDQGGADGVARNVLCNRAEQEAVKAAAALASGDDEIGRTLADVGKDDVDGGPVEDGGLEGDA